MWVATETPRGVEREIMTKAGTRPAERGLCCAPTGRVIGPHPPPPLPQGEGVGLATQAKRRR